MKFLFALFFFCCMHFSAYNQTEKTGKIKKEKIAFSDKTENQQNNNIRLFKGKNNLVGNKTFNRVNLFEKKIENKVENKKVSKK